MVCFEKLSGLQMRRQLLRQCLRNEEREKKIARYVRPFLERSERQCPRVMFRGTRKEAYPEDAYPEMQHVPDT